MLGGALDFGRSCAKASLSQQRGALLLQLVDEPFLPLLALGCQARQRLFLLQQFFVEVRHLAQAVLADAQDDQVPIRRIGLLQLVHAAVEIGQRVQLAVGHHLGWNIGAWLPIRAE